MPLFVANVLILFTLLLASPVAAQDPLEGTEGITVQIHTLPPGIRCSYHGDTYQCFNLGEYRLLLEMDQDLYYTSLRLQESEERAVVLTAAIASLHTEIVGYQSEVHTLQLERTRLVTRWTQENKLRLEAENRPMLGSWIAWGIAALEGAIILGLITAMVVN